MVGIEFKNKTRGLGYRQQKSECNDSAHSQRRVHPAHTRDTHLSATHTEAIAAACTTYQKDFAHYRSARDDIIMERFARAMAKG